MRSGVGSKEAPTKISMIRYDCFARLQPACTSSGMACPVAADGRWLQGRSHISSRRSRGSSLPRPASANSASMSASLSIMATGKVTAAHKKRRRRVEFLDFIRGATGSIRVRTGNGVPGAAWFAEPCPGKSASRTPSRSFEPSAAAPFSDPRFRLADRMMRRPGSPGAFASTIPSGVRVSGNFIPP